MENTTILYEIITEFGQHLKEEEKAKNTVDKYLRDVLAFAAYLNGGELSKEAVIAYKQKLVDDEYAARSVNSILASLNSLFAFLGRSDLKVKSLKIQRKVYCTEDEELTKSEYERLCRTANRKHNKRIYLIIQTIGSTGIRVGELPCITVEAVKKGEATVTSKGKTRTIFLVKELRKKLFAYIKERGLTTGPVFVTRTGKPVNRTVIWREMKALCEEAGVNPKKVFPHNLRHLFARVFYGLEKDIAKLADILGHSSIDTTRIYIISTGSTHRRLMENMRLII